MSCSDHLSQYWINIIVLLLAFAGCLYSSSSLGEVILIPVGQQAPALRDLPRPVRGLSAEMVLDKFGEPNSMTAPVGEPPISKWSYDNYTVYFESSVVIHSVLTHTPKHPIE